MAESVSKIETDEQLDKITRHDVLRLARGQYRGQQFYVADNSRRTKLVYGTLQALNQHTAITYDDLKGAEIIK